VGGYCIARTANNGVNTDKTRVQHAREQLRQQFKERLAVKKKTPKVRPRPPRYDDVFYEGVHALDTLVGSEVPFGHGIVQISDAVLDSKVQEGLRRQEKAKLPGISKEDSKKMKEKAEKKTNTEICLTQEKERT